MLAQTRLLNGDAEGARRTMLDAGGGQDLPNCEYPTRTPWFRLLAHADIVLGDLDGAAEWVRRAEQAAEVTGLHGQRGHALLASATLLSATNDMAGAALAARAAATEFATVHMGLYEAQAHMAAGGLLVAGDDRLAAISEFGQAKALFANGGADALRRQAETQQRGLGGRTKRSAAPTMSGQASMSTLSDRETQIARLVSEGHTNRQIAEQLFMSPRTVEAHLSRIFTKLGVSSRSAVASAIASIRPRDDT
jgi:DNA-binding NarL/FixJ family response regulator